jgi:hypothetical protein
MPPNIGSMIPGNTGPPQRPPAVSGTGESGHTTGRLTNEPSIVEPWKASGSKPAGPDPVPMTDSTNVNAIAMGGPDLLGQMPVKPTSQARPAATGGSGNLVGDGVGKLPPAASGPGTGRQPAAQGATIGQTNARPRSQGGGFLPRK